MSTGRIPPVANPAPTAGRLENGSVLLSVSLHRVIPERSEGNSSVARPVRYHRAVDQNISCRADALHRYSRCNAQCGASSYSKITPQHIGMRC